MIPNLPLEFRVSDTAFFGFVILLATPILLLLALILAIAKQKKAAKKTVMIAGIVLLIGAGLCGIGGWPENKLRWQYFYYFYWGRR